VPLGSTFYPYIHCLSCLGIINGYPDGSFKPNNNVTRGQLSKIVSNSAGFNDDQTVQMFQDVPNGSTFFQYIGRLATRGYIGGYPCGGPGEPCGPTNLPYFRPSANSTRGQVSKIVSNAAGFNDPPGAQMFEDVTPGSTFFDFIQRLASRGVVGGYPCGGPGEPCGPGNLPYFKPSANVTRGQAAKIVANTFFPICQTP
jgi:S-layer homology domain